MASIDPEGAETRAIDGLLDLTDTAIVEIGAGDGRLTRRLATHAKSVLAIETSERDIARARAETPGAVRDRVRFVLADATAYPFPRARFDVAVLSWSL